MRVIAIEEHWLHEPIDARLRALPAGRGDDSLALNERGDIPARLRDIGAGRIAAMDAAGVDVQILSLAPPGTNGLPAADAVTLAREANDRVSESVGAHPSRLAALTTLPWVDPAAALAELARSRTLPGHVGVMAYGRCGERPLDDPAYDELLAAVAATGRPLLLHPQIPSTATRSSLYGGLGEPMLELGIATFGWGWHMEAGLAALRLIVSGAFDRHPDLQVILGHWGEMLLAALDRADSLSGLAGLDRPVSDYVRTNVHITTSGMLVPRLLRQALDFTTVERILLSGDYPFHRSDAADLDAFLDTIPDRFGRERIAHANAEALFHLPGDAGADEVIA